MAKACPKPPSPPKPPKVAPHAKPPGYQGESHAYNWRSRNNLKRGK